tara:strand:+ start:159 stop:1580 length:1422 start_codon:yes stop_codon:yes gene_type:complete
MKKRIYLMMEIKKRELEARLYFAYVASMKGYSVVIAKKGNIWARRKLLRPGIVVFKSIGPDNTKLIDDILEAGHKVVAWDEEAFVTPKRINFFIQYRLNKLNFKKLEYFFTWGEVEYEYLVKEYKEFIDKIYKTGNSRIDILKSENSKVFNSEIDKIKKKHGSFCLFLGNFGRTNNLTFKDKTEGYVKNLVKNGTFKVGDPAHKFALNNEVISRGVFNQLPNLFKEFSLNFPDKKMIVRPHPSEKLEPYKEMLRGIKNVVLETDDNNTLSWIKASDFIISSNCTTSIEAFLLKKASINYWPFDNQQEQEFYLPEKVSLNANNYEELNEIMRNLYKNNFESIKNNKDNESVKKDLIRAFHNYDSKVCSVSEMIKFLDKINVLEREDKKIGFFYFYYYLIRSFARVIKDNLLYLIKDDYYKNYKKYMKAKMVNFKYNELNSKFKIIVKSNEQNHKLFSLKEIIPRIFSIEKKDIN